MYLQHVVGLVPCPMCIVQRYVMVLMGLVALVGVLFPCRKATLWVGGGCCCWQRAARMWQLDKLGCSGIPLSSPLAGVTFTE